MPICHQAAVPARGSIERAGGSGATVRPNCQGSHGLPELDGFAVPATASQGIEDAARESGARLRRRRGSSRTRACAGWLAIVLSTGLLTTR